MQKVIFIALMSLSIIMLGCSSFFIRKECEAINWHQHGYNIAMSGKRATGDETVARCEKAEYNVPDAELDLGFKAGMQSYCKPETAFVIGKDGLTFNPDFCDSPDVRQLRMKHAEGVKLYCHKDNGMIVGASGKKYTQICPKEMEEPFLAEFRKGRKKYLENDISTKQVEIKTIDSDLIVLRDEQDNLSRQMDALPKPYVVKEKVYNAVTGTTTETSKTEDPAWNRRRRLDDELTSLSNRIRTQRDRQDQLRSAINESQKELVSLQ